MLLVFIDWVQREKSSQPGDDKIGQPELRWEEIPTFVICLMPNITPPLTPVSLAAPGKKGGCGVDHEYEVCHGATEFRRHTQQPNNII